MKQSIKFTLLALISLVITGNVYATSQQNMVGTPTQSYDTIVEYRHEGAFFNKIDISMPAEVILVSDTKTYVEVHATNDIIGTIKTAVSGKKLTISGKGNHNNYRTPTIYVHYNILNNISAGNAAIVKNQGFLTAEKFNIKVNNASTVQIEALKCLQLNAQVSKASVLNVNATGNQITLTVDGASNATLDARANKATVQASQASHIGMSIYCEQLTSTANGTSNIKIEGDAKTAKLTAKAVSDICIENFRCADIKKTADITSNIKQ